MRIFPSRATSLCLTVLLSAAACDDIEEPIAVEQPALALLSGSGSFRYEPLVPITGDAACLDVGAIRDDPTDTPFQLPVGFRQTIIARESDIATTNAEVNFDMLTLNETGRHAGRYLYRTHEVSPFAALSVTDLWTGENRLVAERRYVAVTESSDLAVNNGLVLKIALDGERAVVSNYVEPGVNVSVEIPDAFDSDAGLGFDDPDNLALSPQGDLYITEDDSPSDIWVARGAGAVASEVEVFARLLDCQAESTGIYFERSGHTLFVNSQHAGLNGGEDLTVAITRE